MFIDPAPALTAAVCKLRRLPAVLHVHHSLLQVVGSHSDPGQQLLGASKRHEQPVVPQALASPHDRHISAKHHAVESQHTLSSPMHFVVSVAAAFVTMQGGDGGGGLGAGAGASGEGGSGAFPGGKGGGGVSGSGDTQM